MLGQARSLEARDAGLVAADASSSAQRVLVVDDDNLHRMIICRAVAKAGYVPAGAASFEEAAALVQANAFDCITLDLSLGEHAGVEMVRYLSAIGCKAPIIVVTGADYATCKETVKVAEMLNLDVWECIPKPVDLVMLRYSLDKIAHQRDRAALRS